MRLDKSTKRKSRMERIILNQILNMEVILYLVLLLMCGSCLGKQEVKLGVLLPSRGNYPFIKDKVLPAIEYAIESIENSTKLPNHKFVVNYRDSECSETIGPLKAIDLYVDRDVDVFFGPVCDYAVAPIARFSGYWNIPVISAGATVKAFDNKTEYRLLTRIQGAYAKNAEFVLEVAKAFNWTNVGLFFHENMGGGRKGKSNCYFTVEPIFYKLKNQLKFQPKYEQFDENFPNEYDFGELLLKASTYTRIVVLCASADSVRDIMIKAHELNFDNGEYVFLNIDLFSSKNESEKPWYREDDTAERNEKARKAYEALMTVTLRKPTSPEYKHFSEEVKKRAESKDRNFTYGEEEVNSFVGAFHDAVILYAIALNETLTRNLSITNGTEITKLMWNRTFDGITGTVSIDDNGDRNADYSLLDMNPKNGKFEVVANYYGNNKEYKPEPDKKIYWAGGRNSPPPDTPTCGFDGSKCPPSEPFPEYGIVIIVLGSLLVIVLVTAFFIYRHIKLEAELAEMNWRVRWEDIMFGSMENDKKLKRQGSSVSLNRKMSLASSTCSVDTIAVHLSDVGQRQLFTKTGYYKGAIMAIKSIHKTSLTVNKPLLIEVKRIKDLQNDHIVRFIGACIDPPNMCILTEYCQKGSLQDVLENEQIKLDWMFRYSLMQDILRGMTYLFNSDIRSHGNMKSTNCVVDGRFVLKITDFGLHALRGPPDDVEEGMYAFYRTQLWTAPELLRMHYRPPEGTQKGDVYSFAIICQEIVYRSGVFYLANLDLSPEERILDKKEQRLSVARKIHQKVKNGLKPYFRPTLEEADCPCDELAEVIRKCWSEDPMERPDFQALKSTIRKLNKDGDKGNILDNLLSRMEQYANNLEALVEERTSDYLEQKKKAEDLLYMMLPKSVACNLMRGEICHAETYNCVTIYFSDICGFTAMSSESTPMQVVQLLNDLYTAFDSVIENFDVYKVETIGDAYMVVSGLPMRNGNLHAREIARMSISLLNATMSFKIRHRPNEQLKLRIGIHTGPVVAGVVGLKMPRYCLFGDTVNTTSRMESNGLPLRIHVSPCTKEVLDTFTTFDLELRGPVEMKGKGTVITYWLKGERVAPSQDKESII
ncbi:atrial natriuretic peptide receptor 1-like isoform X2 [Mizuhopecten yessoensis]|uniref:atrial natriuretic peptide receptor 1-like isoform X2 n=1 Tax=Mizuhopecten yessoensis TaxID=6573 RepID=UPI000B457A88|nr:atrial natriuretic peptide receptor 1-like isoform X2 [Mizuhopecten yessoensis]